MKILYIAGATRSGSTLLHDIVSQLDGFEGVGELRDIWHYGFLDNRLCGCGLPFRSCDYWSSTLDDAFGDVTDDDARRWADLTEKFRTRDLFFSSPGRRTELRARMEPLLETLTMLYTTIEHRTGSRVIVDSSKNPAYGYLIGMVPELDVRYVHLIRDAPAVAYSLSKRKESEPGRNLPRKGAWESSVDWTARNLATERHLRSPRLMRLRYEDLVSDPEASVLAVTRLMGESGSQLSFLSGDEIEMAVRPHSVFGNPRRFRPGPTKLRTDDQWRSSMAGRAAVAVKVLTFPLRIRYGYVPWRERSNVAV